MCFCPLWICGGHVCGAPVVLETLGGGGGGIRVSEEMLEEERKCNGAAVKVEDSAREEGLITYKRRKRPRPSPDDGGVRRKISFFLFFLSFVASAYIGFSFFLLFCDICC